jgi:GT2 family glycosyltransferase
MHRKKISKLTQPFKYKIAVIIVNYNVEFFLEQCLNSVQKSLENVSGQVFVIDNNSIDGSVEMVERKFPQFNLIANKDNKGFSKANNQGILLADAEYILLLNPDTVVEEDTFSKVIEYMDTHPKTGGLGVRMLDGKGQFLPESKRGLPTPAVAFYKIFGLSKLFPKSKKFGQYHAGHLSEFETNEIDILSGAFMLMRKEALDKVGLLDEAFFMYGEDIDLSYRIQKGGYNNVYFPETRIIHYKGESTKKSSVNYVFVFYKAMIIFAKKHFSQKNAKLFSFFIHLAIYFRAFLAISARFIKQSFLPIVDFCVILFGFNILSNQWKVEQISFPETITHIAFPAYALIWILSILFHGGYDAPLKIKKFIKGNLIGTLIILVVYALLPKAWQFSRLFILIAAAGIFLYYSVSRIALHFIIGEKFNLARRKNKKFAIVGGLKEFNRVKEILKQTNDEIDEIVYVSVNEKEKEAIGTLNQLDQITFIHQINEIIFCAKDTSAQSIIYWMTKINAEKTDFKIAQPDSLSLIGSNSIETAGDLYVLNINSITKEENIRTKRTFDVLASLFFLICSPIFLFAVKNRKKFIQNLLNVLIGKKSIVGYQEQNTTTIDLPRIKPGILHPADELTFNDDSITDKLNLIYARDYKVVKDFTIVSKAFKKLDR